MKKRTLETTAFSLHLMAMAFMLCDHLYWTVLPEREILTWIGRLAFPIFAFMIVEGYFHTRNLRNYVLRLLLWAVISEIPFDLVVESSAFAPERQNVLWTFLLGIMMIRLNEQAKDRGKMQLLTALCTLVFGYLLGLLGGVDYGGAGVLTVLVFYFFRGRKWWNFLGQAAFLYFLNRNLMYGRGYMIFLFGHGVFLWQQSFALLALLPIWLYRGKQGPHSKGLRLFYYSFYPVHLLILGLIKMLR